MVTISLTPEQFEAKKVEAAQNGISITADSGVIETHGCTFQYAYDGTNLELTALSTPWLISKERAESFAQSELSK